MRPAQSANTPRFHPDPVSRPCWNAANAITTAMPPVRSDHERNLQGAIDDVRTWCHGKDTVAAVEITNIIRSHHV